MKVLNTILCTLFLSFNIYSYEVDVAAIETDTFIEFDNYVGPYLFYNTVEDIRNIGKFLAGEIEPGEKGYGDYASKYLMYHRPRLEWEESVTSCDIFTITSKSYIDNIENIKLILSQYLIDNYGYSLDDSMLISQLLVVYNAVYRGDVEHFSKNYTSEGGIVDSGENLGIDLHYYNWPGKTNIFIPLAEDIIVGKLATIDTDQIIDSEVIEHIKENEDDDITIREEIVEYKEREFDQVKEDIKEEKTELEEKKEVILEAISEDPEDEDLKEDLKNVEEDLVKVEEKEEALKEKEEKILEIRDELAEDKKEEIEIKKESDSSSLINFVINRELNGELFGQLVKLDPSGKVIVSSGVNTIRENNFLLEGDFIYLIAGGDKENQIISIGKLDKNSLELLYWGEILCYKKTPIFSRNGNIYCVVTVEGQSFIGEFGPKMNILRRSITPINKESFIALNEDIFYIQGENNSIKLVNLSDFVPVLED